MLFSDPDSCRPPRGRASLPEFAPMSVSPTFTHLCSSQHPSGSAGGDPIQAARGAEPGKAQPCGAGLAVNTFGEVTDVVVLVEANVERLISVRSDSFTSTSPRCSASSC